LRGRFLTACAQSDNDEQRAEQSPGVRVIPHLYLLPPLTIYRTMVVSAIANTIFDFSKTNILNVFP
jgi:hypothetical protein